MKVVAKLIAVGIVACASKGAASEWSNTYLEKIRQMGDSPSGADLSLLAVLSSNEATTEEEQLVRSEAWGVLEKHENFPRNLVEWIAESRKEWKKTGIPNRYDSERFKVINSMGGLPDVRVVEKLGELLYDMEWTVDPIEHMQEGFDATLMSPNGQLAARSLAR